MLKIDKYDHYLLRKLRVLEREHPDDYAKVKLHVSARYTGEIKKLQESGMFVTGSAGGIAIGVIAAGDLDQLEQLENVAYIGTEGPIRTHLDTSVPEIHADILRTGEDSYTGAGVIVGIIDSGIDIFHKNFLKPDGTSRILSIWDQTLAPTHPPTGYTIGVEFSADDIKNALANKDQPFAHQDVVGHGTHVAGIAAGNGSMIGHCELSRKYWGVAPEADLIIVKVLPEKTSANQDTSITNAVMYIFQQALAGVVTKPAVVNLSLQRGLGPHDGTTDDELFIDGLLAPSTGHAVVASAGNDGDLGTEHDVEQNHYTAGFHSSKHINANGHATITLMVPPDYSEVGYLDIWYSAGAGRLEVALTGPGGVVAGPAAPGSHTKWPPGGPFVVEVDSSLNSPHNNKGRISIYLDPVNGSVAAGTWTITLTEKAGTAVDMDLWVFRSNERSNPVLAFPDRVTATTLAAPGTAKNVITVGAYGSVDGELAARSSRGPTLAADNRQKPDICAPGLEESPEKGIVGPKAKADGGCCCDCCYDSYTEFIGTSQAAPHVTGVVALMLQKNGYLTFDVISATIQKFCRPPAGVIPLPNNDWGYGKVDAQLAVANIPPGIAKDDPTLAGGGPGVPRPDGSTASKTTEGAPVTAPPETGAKPLPPVADLFSRSSLRIATALRDLAVQGKDNPAAQIVMGLVSTHFDEVLKLINGNRRVAAKWHRMFGPEVLRHMLWNKDRVAPAIPATIRNQDIGRRMIGLFDVLSRYGSATLRKDLNDYGSLLLAVPGATFSGLSSLSLSEIFFVPTRNA